MKKEEMMLKATQMLAKGKFKLKKAGPTIMIVGAAIGGVTAAVLACKATLKAEEIIAEHNAQIETIHTTKAQVDSGEMQLKDGETYTADDMKKDITATYVHTAVWLAKVYAEKHKLDYKRSERESGIQELKKKWQIRVDEDGNEHFGGASTLLSRRKQTVYVPERKGSARIDKETGELIYKESGRRYFDKKKGEFVDAQQKVSLISMTPDARTLSSGTPQENLYADFSNELKALARKARKEAANMKGLVYSPAAAKEYRAEVDSINAKLESVIANKPKERRAMVIANANIKAKIQALDLDPKLDKKEIKKISSVEMQRARDSIGASGSKTRITFTDREWEAVQKGAISDSKLTKILNASKSDEIVKRAMPKTATVITNAKMAKAKAMLANGYTYNEIAKACGVPESTVYSALNK